MEHRCRQGDTNGSSVRLACMAEVVDVTDVAGVRALSGRAVEGLTVEAVRAGEIGLADLRIHPETLERQAVVAAEHGNPQLADNLRRAAELTALAGSLADRGLPRCAALVAEATDVYARRGLTA